MVQRLLHQQKVACGGEGCGRQGRPLFTHLHLCGQQWTIHGAAHLSLSVYNLGVVNHGHDYGGGVVSPHMYAHVYHEGVGKKGANNVASLIVKNLPRLNLLASSIIAAVKTKIKWC
jgi:hypothetical protein